MENRNRPETPFDISQYISSPIPSLHNSPQPKQKLQHTSPSDTESCPRMATPPMTLYVESDGEMSEDSRSVKTVDPKLLIRAGDIHVLEDIYYRRKRETPVQSTPTTPSSSATLEFNNLMDLERTINLVKSASVENEGCFSEQFRQSNMKSGTETWNSEMELPPDVTKESLSQNQKSQQHDQFSSIQSSFTWTRPISPYHQQSFVLSPSDLAAFKQDDTSST